MLVTGGVTSERQQTRRASVPGQTHHETHSPRLALFLFCFTDPITYRSIEAGETPCPLTVGEWNANSLK